MSEKLGRSFHFIGICGVAMAQVAAWLKRSGREVTGSDQGVYPPMSDFLKSEGIEVLSPYSRENLKNPDTVVIGNALSRGNPEVEAALDRRLHFISLPELIHSEILAQKLPAVVAGTHGKTTTSAALAHILQHCGLSGGYLIGGLPIGWESGFNVTDGDWFTIEGDEYDTAFFDKRSKFLLYQPQLVVLNNIEFDHADIYSSIDDIVTQFKRLVRLIPGNGHLIANVDDPIVEQIAQEAFCTVISFGKGTFAQVRSELIEVDPSGMRFVLQFASGKEYQCKTALWGEHQLSNLTAAAATAEAAGASTDAIAEAIYCFEGVQRRLEQRYTNGRIWVYDDFAHHPTAIKAALDSVRARHPDIPVFAAFEPRSNTMVRQTFQGELADALSIADYIVLGGIHRGDQIASDQKLSITQLETHLTGQGRKFFHHSNVEKIIEWILERLPKEAVIITMSNGAFSGLSSRLSEKIAFKFDK